MKPYYSDESVTIYHADCRELLPELSADLVLTDPPYPTAHLEYGQRGLSEVGSMSIPQVWFWPGNAPFPQDYSAVSVWDKQVGVAKFELIYSFNWQGIHDLFKRYFINSTVAANYGGDQFNEHPSQKPIRLMRDVLLKCPEGIVLDPFMGSGTTLRAAKDLNRKAIGIEIDERYCEIAAKRMAQTVMAL
jgi:DNA modification methylase